MVRARILGSNPLDFLVRCVCGRRDTFRRALWQATRVAKCRWCGRLIAFSDLTVVDVKGGFCVGDELHEFEPSPDRDEIIRELEGLTGEAQRVADLLDRKGYKDDAHKVRNIAQSVSARRCLMAQTFAIEDRDAA
jgi:hypothetical protein